MALETTDIFLDQIDARGRHMQRGVLGKSKREIFLDFAVFGDLVHAHEAGDAMGNVDDVVAGFEIEKAESTGREAMTLLVRRRWSKRWKIS